jgi:histidinol dehydrogenase
MESAMTFKQGVSGNLLGNRHRTRHLLNQEFMQALLLNFRHQGKKAIEKVARTQPAAYLKILALLVPRELKVEQSQGVKAMSDEQIEQAIEAIQTMLAAQAEKTKIIEATAEPTALPGPAEVRQLQRKRSNRLLEHVDAAIDPSDGGEANLSSLSKNS